jgi:hypothetical protein
MRVLALFLMLSALPIIAFAESLPTYIQESQVNTLRAWLSANDQYRLAIDSDCECSDDIDELRRGDGAAWSPQPNFHPYYAKGDFDGDGFEDVAVVAVPRIQEGIVRVVIFFGSKAGISQEAQTIAERGSSVANRGLFIARSSQGNQHRHAVLLFGAFGSEADPVPVKHPRSTTPNTSETH